MIYPSFLLVLLSIFLLSQAKKPTPILDVTAKYLTFQQYQVLYLKKYDSAAQSSLRKAAYQQNLLILSQLNCQACGVGPLFDRTPKQLAMLTGLKLNGLVMNQTLPQFGLITTQNIRRVGTNKKIGAQAVGAIDWRTKNMLTPVKDQGNCGSCWSFAAVGLLESYLIKFQGQTTDINLSEQFLLDCDVLSAGCNGGDSQTAVNYAIKNGILSEESDAYLAKSSGTCPAKSEFTFPKLTYKSYYSTRTKMPSSTLQSLLNNGPVIIYACASTWYLYNPTGTNKIFKCRSSDSTKANKMNHAILLAGVTADSYIIKNSWGTTYGQQGYIEISNNPKYDCGIGFYVGYWA